ncbi:hypothetical protein ANN_00017 [Periplaneta americana]|uniref:DUF4817 domain-containing protein n=1 Tax=Periplaneta americana TaxID=6978 RepID=A0ABQ8TRG1_PERAM|nr:hypothetical protein ANN_00017 [Periplaneta americana]
MTHRYSIDQRVFMYDNYVLTNSAREVRKRYRETFPGVKVPNRSTIHDLMKKSREIGGVTDKKRRRRRTVLTEENLDDIGHRLENCPTKSIRRLSQEMGISYSSVRGAIKLLKLRRNKINEVQERRTGDIISSSILLRLGEHIEQRVFMYDNYVLTSSAREVIKRYRRTFPDDNVPSRKTVHDLMKKSRKVGGVIDKKRTRRRTVLTEENLDDIGYILEKFPTKSIRRISRETGLCYGSVRNAVMLLKMGPHKITEMQELGPDDIASSSNLLSSVLDILVSLPEIAPKMANRYSIKQRVFMYDNYVLTNSAREVRRRYRETYPGDNVPSRNTIHDLMKKSREIGGVTNKKRRRRRTVLTEENLDDIGYRLENSPTKSIRRISEETGVPYASVRNAIKLLGPYKITEVEEPILGDSVTSSSSLILEDEDYGYQNKIKKVNMRIRKEGSRTMCVIQCNMAQFRYSIPQRVFIYDSYVRTESARTVRRLFQEKFPGVQVPNRSSIQRLVSKSRETGSVLDKKRRQPRTVLTEETLDNIGHALENSPTKSLRRLSQQMGISYGSIRTATKLLKLKPLPDMDRFTADFLTSVHRIYRPDSPKTWKQARRGLFTQHILLRYLCLSVVVEGKARQDGNTE